MLLDPNGNAVRLGRQIGRTGGEGSVYAVDGRSDLVAKIYHAPPAQSKVAKLEYQSARLTSELKKCAAWPLSIIADDSNQPRGFVMPAVSGKEIHHLFGTRDRVVEFPGKNWDFLINTARNCATAFDVVHATGAVIGDVNEGNVLVHSNGTVALIDCDSYQITNGSNAWTCDVGIALWTPPELQGQNFRGLIRTANHDLFGLATLIFKLLFMGRHPFAGIPISGAEILLEDAISKRFYAFSPVAITYGVRPPPFSFPVTGLPEPYSSMFDRAFRLNVERPTAREWVQALDSLQVSLVQCARDRSHRYPKFLDRCPWCEIAAAGGPLFFVSVDVTEIRPLGDDAPAFWAAICRIQKVQLLPKRPSDVSVPPLTPASLPPNISKTRPVFIFGFIMYAIALTLLIAGAGFPVLIVAVFATGMIADGRGTPEFKTEVKRRGDLLSQIQQEVASITAQLDDMITKYSNEFDSKLSDLKEAYQRYCGLDQERQIEMRKLEQEKRQLQLNEFLRAQLISRTKITGIGDSRRQRLLSFGIGSALDIKPNLRIPGFGPTNMSHLLNWRAMCESRFRYEPTRPVPLLEIQRVNLKFATIKSDLSAKLRLGPTVLTNLSAGGKGRYLQLAGQLEIAVRRLAQAHSDYQQC